jgi:hypothetical protein
MITPLKSCKGSKQRFSLQCDGVYPLILVAWLTMLYDTNWQSAPLWDKHCTVL